MTVTPSSRLREAVKQVEIVREKVSEEQPEQDSTLAEAEALLRGVADHLDDVEEDLQLIPDGGQSPDGTDRTLQCWTCYGESFGLYWDGDTLMARCRQCGETDRAGDLHVPDRVVDADTDRDGGDLE